MSSALPRFLRYVQVHTESDPASPTCPSTERQKDLGRMLVDELLSLGLKDAAMDENGYVMASLPANIPAPPPPIGFIAHMDTSPDFCGAGVRPQIVRNYDGGSIALDAEKGIFLSPGEFPELSKYVGQDLVTTDGSTLLGADDKAGIAAIMAAVETWAQNPELPHPAVKIGFTPDEEIGRGAAKFDIQKFGADFAFTVDGGEVGELTYENFNAAGAQVILHGRSVHPGEAKDKMVNALLLGMEFNAMLPPAERPMHTTDYEGFFHLLHFSGSVEEARMTYILRDFNPASFEKRKQLMESAAAYLNLRHGKGSASLQIQDQYRNMKEKIAPRMEIIDLARRAMQACSIEPQVIPIRGGTDGAMLSYAGLPTPNIFYGGLNAHGRYEFLPVPSLEKSVEVILKIVELYSAE